MRDQRLRQHFGEIAPWYRKVRENDDRAVRLLAGLLVQRASPGARLRLLDVGSGTGRYLEAMTSQVVRADSVSTYAVGVDESLHMLLAAPQRQRPDACTTRVVGAAEALPFSPGMFDAVLSFNAVHHFDLAAFLHEAARALRPGGRLVIYTRTPEQNRRTIWGRYLPGFAERETRLFEDVTLRAAIRETTAFCHIRSRTIPWSITTTLARLLQQARAFHYSTFRLYSPAEFDEALEVFADGLVRAFGGPWDIAARNDHQLVLARRRPAASRPSSCYARQDASKTRRRTADRPGLRGQTNRAGQGGEAARHGGGHPAGEPRPSGGNAGRAGERRSPNAPGDCPGVSSGQPGYGIHEITQHAER